MSGNETPELPIINLSDKNLKPDTELWNSTRDRVREAMEHHGWFVAEYNNFPVELHQSILGAAKELLDLPPDIKIKKDNHKAGHGYITMMSDAQLVHEGLGVDQVNDVQQCRRFSRLMWPDHHDNDRFCEIVHAYAKMQADLEQLVIRMLFESFNLEKYVDKHIEGTRYLLRLLKYRRLPNGEPNRKFISHTDKTFISILHQNHITGLMLKSEKEDVWYPFIPSPTRFAVIAGDAIMAWSNDRIKACYHKVEMESVETRYSLGFFSFQEGIISTPEEMVDKDHPLAYKPFRHDGLLEYYETLEAHRTMTKAYCGIPQT
ncbi:PREDICTED: probable 2-oxoglutarate-dependent dioxygenase AOP1 isoform X2 [Camelina sativa]|nr:PREDICTED: probable 2-oxoglutarate-dependent dioxygenase AOP1 isoform X2 [Camelina sativa]XP_019091973.1 PREDICTED: probable 2-oxoglutarate-dependent dioxygenase AOP1 isoform X2 [Camelina sativa]